MASKIKIQTGNKKPVMVDEPDFLKAMYTYIRQRWDNNHHQINLVPDNNEMEFIIVPNTIKNNQK